MANELTKRQKFCYGVGHVLNDLCASMWFSYLLVFFHEILQFSNSMAGYVILIGQLADGLATPLVGYESDKSIITCQYGKRKSWHLIGTICVALTFPLLFINCIGCAPLDGIHTPEYAQFVYYAPLVVIFQIGWASTQINHLALIPDLADTDGDKVTLNSIRYAFTVISSIVVYGIAWVVLDIPSSSSKSGNLSPSDAPAFRTLVLVVVGIGIMFSLIFHVGLKEDHHKTHDCCEENEVNTSAEDYTHENGQACESDLLLPRAVEEKRIVHWYDWFKQAPFYLMAALYMCTRLIVNLSQVYIPMYLTDTLHLHKRYIAIIPLVVYLSSFVATVLCRPISTKIKQEVMYICGSVLVLMSCIWAHFMDAESMQIFGMSVLLGAGSSVILVMSLSMTARLIGRDSSTGAFVYGAMSLTDKLSNGAAVFLIQNLNPCLCKCSKCDDYFRDIMSYVIGSIMVIAIGFNILIAINKKSQLTVRAGASSDDLVAKS